MCREVQGRDGLWPLWGGLAAERLGLRDTWNLTGCCNSSAHTQPPQPRDMATLEENKHKQRTCEDPGKAGGHLTPMIASLTPQ